MLYSFDKLSFDLLFEIYDELKLLSFPLIDNLLSSSNYFVGIFLTISFYKLTLFLLGFLW